MKKVYIEPVQSVVKMDVTDGILTQGSNGGMDDGSSLGNKKPGGGTANNFTKGEAGWASGW